MRTASEDKLTRQDSPSCIMKGDDDTRKLCDVGGQMPTAAAAAAMLGNYGPMLAYTPAHGHPAAIMSAAGTILLAAAPPGSATPACTVLLVSNLNEEVRVR